MKSWIIMLKDRDSDFILVQRQERGHVLFEIKDMCKLISNLHHSFHILSRLLDARRGVKVCYAVCDRWEAIQML